MKLFAVAGWKYEPEWLVDKMKENMSFFDEICIVDTRNRKEFWIDEGYYRKLQRKELQKKGIKPGDWVFVTSPDERLETGAESEIKSFMAQYVDKIGSFPLKEMWTPTAFRVDGIWNNKTRPRLYQYRPGQIFSSKRIQQAPVPVLPKCERLPMKSRIYHLKNIEPENRINRAEAYKKMDPEYRYMNRRNPSLRLIDPDRKLLNMGYDYLYNEEGMVLRTIEKGREFTPPYNKKYFFTPKFE